MISLLAVLFLFFLSSIQCQFSFSFHFDPEIKKNQLIKDKNLFHKSIFVSTGKWLLIACILCNMTTLHK